MISTVQMYFPCPVNFSQQEITNLKPDLSYPGPDPDHLGQTMEYRAKNSLIGEKVGMPNWPVC
jgi:hypothetical protein